MQKQMRLVLTGGGTGGHILPNIVLIQELKKRHGRELELLYVGSRRGMERKMIGDIGVRYKGIFTGKIRRYFSLRNALDLFLLPIGIVQALFILMGFRPKVVFSKGGFVSFPVTVAARMLGIPVVLHESDVVPGLANKVMGKFARKICVAYGETAKFFESGKVTLTGNLVRCDIVRGDRAAALDFTGLKGNKPVLLFMGGSLGAQFLNDFVLDNLDDLLKEYEVVHICGAGKVREVKRRGYCAFEYVGDEMKDLYALADIVVSRSGANTLAELAALGKPAILIPLGKNASRGDQIINARAYAKEHSAIVILEDEFNKKAFFADLKRLLAEHPEGGGGGLEALASSGGSAVDKIITLLEEL
ncbi:undecaprenyldiphospho-muramoylpentapeptide beta-N-acetylglucosaminyltransferase [Patescibacteria group bacterium]|nr:undecaprenyldiphospho-muramoylpentapeptide beta-N-acetylglucosaminyltransferase [Patescibacteria group bacterium]